MSVQSRSSRQSSFSRPSRSSHRARLAGLAAAALVLLPGIASAADGVALAKAKSLGPHLSAFPRISDADASGLGDDGVSKINAALAKADARVEAAASECRDQAKDAGSLDENGGGWERSVNVTWNGPGFLSFLVTDSYYCGGAYPSEESFPLVFDFATGSPVNWARYLPASLMGKATLESASDGTRLGVVSSPALVKLYLGGYVSAANAVATASDSPALDAESVKECEDVITDSLQGQSFVIWPQANPVGLAVMPLGLPHAIAACGVAVVIPPAKLKSLGAKPAFLDALAGGAE